jgi:hypothetical protein
MTHGPRINVNQADNMIANLLEFTTRSGIHANEGLRAESQIHGSIWPGTGQLPQEWIKPFQDAVRKEMVEYVVYSGQTPIAWLLSDRTIVIPPVKYSTTITSHQEAAKSGFQSAFGPEYGVNLATTAGAAQVV